MNKPKLLHLHKTFIRFMARHMSVCGSPTHQHTNTQPCILCCRWHFDNNCFIHLLAVHGILWVISSSNTCNDTKFHSNTIQSNRRTTPNELLTTKLISVYRLALEYSQQHIKVVCMVLLWVKLRSVGIRESLNDHYQKRESKKRENAKTPKERSKLVRCCSLSRRWFIERNTRICASFFAQFLNIFYQHFSCCVFFSSHPSK